MRPSSSALFLVLAFAAACTNGGAGGDRPPATGTVAEDEATCRAIAFETVQNLPAVRSGRTTYIPGGAGPYYDSCMTERGHVTYPPY